MLCAMIHQWDICKVFLLDKKIRGQRKIEVYWHKATNKSLYHLNSTNILSGDVSQKDNQMHPWKIARRQYIILRESLLACSKCFMRAHTGMAICLGAFSRDTVQFCFVVCLFVFNELAVILSLVVNLSE